MKILVTGSAGFIGYYMVKKLTGRSDEIVGLDNINDYYDVNLKYGRLKESGIDKEQISENTYVQSNCYPNYQFIQMDLNDGDQVRRLFKDHQFDRVVHMAAQAGVRYSIENPQAYLNSNLNGFFYILEACREAHVEHLVYASSSSVYGLNGKMPFSVHDGADHPVSLYGATKKANELMAHAYSQLYNIPTTGLRFFTVYGPWGRPDMAYFLFTEAILNGKPIEVFNQGDMQRDFTYIDDIVSGVIKVLDHPAAPNQNWDNQAPDAASSSAPYRVYNIGRGSPVNLMDFIHILEDALGKKAEMRMRPMQPGDVIATWADTSALEKDVQYHPDTDFETGIREFVSWYREYYQI